MIVVNGHAVDVEVPEEDFIAPTRCGDVVDCLGASLGEEVTCADCLGVATHERAPVQGDRGHPLAGTISWVEHLEAFLEYARRYGRSQSVERIAERGGFSYGELLLFLGHAPTTWEPLKMG
jgi:hypothetical protein